MEQEKNLKYLKLLSQRFKNIKEASSEIINLQAILNLPKGTEHFLSDIHGEDEAFLHILKNGSGALKYKIEDIFEEELTQKEKDLLATLIYYPREVLDSIEVANEWYERVLHQLVLVCREVSSKYTKSKVRKALPKDYAYIIEELLHEQENMPDKLNYYEEIIRTIIKINQADSFIVEICELIQRLAIDHLHIIGDIYDRGPGAEIIMEELMNYHSVDIQWGNHEIVWMGASMGSLICIANVIRVSAKYGNMSTLEEGYGINMFPLIRLAMIYYQDVDEEDIVSNERQTLEVGYNKMLSQIYKAITIIQFKLEGQLIKRNPTYDMEDRLLLHRINYKEGTMDIGEETLYLKENTFPTIDINDPYKLTDLELEAMQSLKNSFLNNEKLHKHMAFLLSKGSMYKVFNGNLLFHGCIPMTLEGEFEGMQINGIEYKGKELLDKFEQMVRERFNRRSIRDEEGSLDIFWYLWAGKKSSLFGKERMTTFERYFLEDKAYYHEEKNPYYQLIENVEICNKILKEFGLTGDTNKIINGHVPVQVRKGESPIKSSGKLYVIDGGLSKEYQKVTGIAGYTLIYNSHGMILSAHESFESKKVAIQKKKDIISNLKYIEKREKRVYVKETDIGKELNKQKKDLERLVELYRKGVILQN